MSSPAGLITLDSMADTWMVERLDIEGEELPVLLHVNSWIPAPLALRYVLRTRFALSPSVLFSELRGICILYNWAASDSEVGDLEEFLTTGKLLNRSQLQRLLPHLRQKQIIGSGQLSNRQTRLVSSSIFNLRLSGTEQFLIWGIDPGNHGGLDTIDENALEEQIRRLTTWRQDNSIKVTGARRREPITAAEIELIRRAIGPDEFGEFPPGVFTESTRYRNWIMFETALNLGVRKGELLTLQLIHLPASSSDSHFFIPRQQDEDADPRKRRRLRGKTNEREVILMDRTLLSPILKYRDAVPPTGRNDPRIKSQYLFVNEDGHPVSSSTAGYIIRQIGKYAIRLLDADESFDDITRKRLKESLSHLTWHRLRHTWAENAALVLYEEYREGAWAILKEWGGWNSYESMER